MATHTLNTLNRTEHIKFTTYGGDGNGRDSYIISNDGGLMRSAPEYKGAAQVRDNYNVSNRIVP